MMSFFCGGPFGHMFLPYKLSAPLHHLVTGSVAPQKIACVQIRGGGGGTRTSHGFRLAKIQLYENLGQLSKSWNRRHYEGSFSINIRALNANEGSLDSSRCQLQFGTIFEFTCTLHVSCYMDRLLQYDSTLRLNHTLHCRDLRGFSARFVDQKNNRNTWRNTPEPATCLCNIKIFHKHVL
jgi:hypothetical protein